MCTNYTPTSRDRLKAARLGVAHLPPNEWPLEVFPGYVSPIVLRPDAAPALNAPLLAGDVLRLEVARFGLIPGWCRDAAHASSIAKGTYNARSETVAEKPSFRSAWKARQFALVPMESYFDPNWEEAERNGGRSVRWRIAMQSGEPFTCAALWERWQDRASGECITSFTLLTVNADGHALCGRLHRPGDEKRMPAIIAANDHLAWLNARPDEARGFLRPTDAALMTGGPAPLPQRAARAGRVKRRESDGPGPGEVAEAAKPAEFGKGKKAVKLADLKQNNYSLF